MMKMDLSTQFELNNGVKIPIFGLGTYHIKSQKAVEIFQFAIENGIRSFDTASLYGNEREVGEAIRKCNIPRKEVFVTTKLWNSDHGYERALKAFEVSLKKLSIDYIDLYLIHWPIKNKRKESWRALESLVETDQVRAIGVSNYMINHLEELLEYCNVVPVVNQVEFHPFLFRKDLLEYCKDHEIQLDAYSPLTKGRRINDPRLAEIGVEYSKTPAQILIRWVLQHGVRVIPKSSNKGRILENINVFDFSISEEDMETLNSFSDRYVSSWDPTDTP